MNPRFSRYVALGDSTTEGLDDPYPDGTYRGWADRLAERLAVDNPDFGYANLAIRGRKVPQIRAEQLEPALALKPDLASVIGGLNDILRRNVDLDLVCGDLEAMIEALRGDRRYGARDDLPRPDRSHLRGALAGAESRPGLQPPPPGDRGDPRRDGPRPRCRRHRPPRALERRSPPRERPGSRADHHRRGRGARARAARPIPILCRSPSRGRGTCDSPTMPPGPAVTSHPG